LVLTHEEIAEMIGTTRETVSRLFADFRKKQFIKSKGSSVVILNKFALERIVQAWMAQSLWEQYEGVAV
jgi:CRP/FNR family cyclic AMP-dependent transcriptional regulator